MFKKTGHAKTGEQIVGNQQNLGAKTEMIKVSMSRINGLLLVHCVDLFEEWFFKKPKKIKKLLSTGAETASISGLANEMHTI